MPTVYPLSSPAGAYCLPSPQSDPICCSSSGPWNGEATTLGLQSTQTFCLPHTQAMLWWTQCCQVLRVTRVLKVWWKEASVAPASGRTAATSQWSCVQNTSYQRRGCCKKHLLFSPKRSLSPGLDHLKPSTISEPSLPFPFPNQWKEDIPAPSFGCG